jgi:hypothetical protein
MYIDKVIPNPNIFPTIFYFENLEFGKTGFDSNQVGTDLNYFEFYLNCSRAHLPFSPPPCYSWAPLHRLAHLSAPHRSLSPRCVVRTPPSRNRRSLNPRHCCLHLVPRAVARPPQLLPTLHDRYSPPALQLRTPCLFSSSPRATGPP